MRVLVKGPVNTVTGYGVDIVSLCRALMAWGVDVFLQPVSLSPPVPADVLMLLTKACDAPFDLAIVHQDPNQLETNDAMKAAAGLTVGWSMWEWSRYTHEEHPTKTLNSRLDKFDVVIAYDDVSYQALEEHVAVPPIIVLQGGYDPAEWPYAKQRDWYGETFNFCMQGALHDRKQPFLAIEAFKELKDEFSEFASAQLHLKTIVPGLHPSMMNWCPGLFIYHEVWTLQKLQDFYSQMHVILCPSQGEGKNLPALQFLSTGGGCIATNWGGHTQWLSDQYAYPLDYVLSTNSVGASHAVPDKKHLKALMLHAFRNRDEVSQKGKIAAQTIPLMCSWETVLERLFDRLAQVHPAGRAVKEVAVMCRKPRDTEHLELRKKSLC